MMPQFRKITSAGKYDFWVPSDGRFRINPGAGGTTSPQLEMVGFQPIKLAPATLDEVLYILTMRDPAEHCDPLPHFLPAPGFLIASGGHVERGAGQRRAGEEPSHDLEQMPEDRSEAAEEERARFDLVRVGWGKQQAIAQSFYDEHVVGWE